MGRIDQSLFYFDEEAADRVCRFYETQLQHFEGRFAGKPFTLLPWQRTILREVFGWKRKGDGTRRYRTVYIEKPRKCGKSAFASGIAIYLLSADNEAGAQVYSAAVTTQQSSITFDAAKKMVAASPALKKRVKPYRYHLTHPKSQSIYKTLSGESEGSHGKNIHGLVIDELHEWTSPGSRELFDALTTSMGSREQPLTVMITTAGYGGDETLCRQMHDTAVQWLAGESDDDTFYASIHAADPQDDWTDPEVWAKAIPSLGETVSVEYIQRECVKAQETPSFENVFKRLYLNIWTEQSTRWLTLDKWDACTAPLNYDDLKGSPCYVSLDLSQSYDLTAVDLIYPRPGRWIVYPMLYCPRDTADRRTRDDGIPYAEWIKSGAVIPTAGSTIDYDQIEADVLRIAKENQVIEVAYDPYNASAMVNHLEQAGITTIPVRQGYMDMSRACKEFERRLTAGEIQIAENPCLRWQAGAVEVESDKHGNIRPVKPSAKGKFAGTSKYKIDGIVALITGISRAMLRDDIGQESNAAPAIVFI